jgi:hypothetical protein
MQTNGLCKINYTSIFKYNISSLDPHVMERGHTDVIVA